MTTRDYARNDDIGGIVVVVDPDERELSALITLVSASRRIAVFTGAGMSTESGIPDYRGPGGVWERGAIPTLADFRDRVETREAYWQRRRDQYPALVGAPPNQGHRAIVDLHRGGLLLAVVTQNIDGLHQAAGLPSELVIELHGSAHTIRCMSCRSTSSAAEVQRRLETTTGIPPCLVCGGILRTATILFGETIPPEPLERAIAVARACDLMVVVGSSLVVNPAAKIPVLAKQRGAKLAIINRTPTPLDALADVRLAAEAGSTLAAIVAGVSGRLSGANMPSGPIDPAV